MEITHPRQGRLQGCLKLSALDDIVNPTEFQITANTSTPVFYGLPLGHSTVKFKIKASALTVNKEARLHPVIFCFAIFEFLCFGRPVH